MPTPSRGLRTVRTYTHQDKEAAFECYMDSERGNRSLRKTAQIMDFPIQTVISWNTTLAWQARMFEQDQREAALIRQSVEMRLVNELERLLDKAFELAYYGDKDHKTQADMTRYLLGVMRVSPVQKVEQDVIDNRLNRISPSIVNELPADLTREQLIARVNAMILGEMTEIVEGAFHDLPTDYKLPEPPDADL